MHAVIGIAAGVDEGVYSMRKYAKPASKKVNQGTVVSNNA
jgi:hypothetical protein